LIQRFKYPYYINLLSGVGWVGATFLLTVLVSPRLRMIVKGLRIKPSMLG
jgi:hypothetical protein